ncbi:hypothetical protein ACVWZ4_007222 [Bradyrhizobium sp. USDA 4472]
MDRRSLLKSAAALSAAAALPAATSAPAAIAADAAVPAVVAPLKANPYTNYVWEWFVSHDGETYYEGFPTKEEALQYAQQCDYSLIAECHQQDFRLDIDGYWLIDHLNDANCDLIGEGDGIEATNEQRLDLEKMVQSAIEAWVVKHNIKITAWTFDGTQNETNVPLPAAS